MNIGQYLGTRTLNFKLNALLALMLGILLLVLLVVLSTNFQELLAQVGRQNIDRDVEFIQDRLSEFEDEVLNAARLLANAPGLASTLSSGDLNALRASLLVEASSLGLDELIVTDLSGNYLLRQVSSRNYDPGRIRQLVDRGSIGLEVTGILATDSTPTFMALVGVAPVIQSSGSIVGVIVAGKTINVPFLQTLNLQPEETRLGFLTREHIVLDDSAAQGVPAWLSQDSVEVNQAFEGETLTLDDIAASEAELPSLYAYIPIRLGGQVQGVVAIQHNFETLRAYQNRLTTSAVLVVTVVAVTLVAIVAVFAQRVIIRPINQLKSAAERMAAGDLKTRAVTKTGDEIGELSTSFNSMATQLGTLVVTLEERIAEAQAALERAEIADNAKSAFLASMSHELRTPLNAIINFSKFLAKGMMGEVNERQLEALDKVIGSAKHLLNLINDVLDMSKIESDSLTLFVETSIDVGSIITHTVATAESLLENKPVEVVTEIAPDLPTIKADRQRILQILLNIVSNACKFTDEGTITVRAMTAGDEIRILVQDTGPGIAPEDYAVVFEPFKQTNTGLRQGGGTGLGMPISKRLAEAHGGRLWLESTLGQGTTFYIALPIASEILSPTIIEAQNEKPTGHLVR